jgi:transcriptional regulator with XRE-family HTH domain
MAFADALKLFRQQRGMTQPGLAAASGVPVGTIRDYEQGKRDPLLSNARKLALALRVSLDDLADGPAPPQTGKKPRGRARKGK